ncbi:MAG: hypothetical protein LLG05_13090 [Porphyromonadaceae bacterium]|nr:hypothetical protein [Porphyromonadaceae bacterium]
MKGYPKVIATKQDFINLLAEPEFKAQALADLQAVYDLQDDTLERVVSYDTDDKGQMINVVTETVAAAMPRWKQLGFESRESVLELYNSY